jgi:hypothetical protein
MREQIEERLAALRQEFEAGRRMLADLEARQVELQQTLLRIGGAVQVLEELLGSEAADIGEPPVREPVPDGSAVDGRVPAGTV